MAITKKQLFAALKYSPHKGQEQIHGALDMPEVRTVVVVAGTRLGKTLAAAHEMVYEALRPRPSTPVNPNGEFMGWCVGPDKDKANLVFDACVQLLNTYLSGHIRVNRSVGVIEFTNLSGGRARIMLKTAQDAGGKGKLVGYAVDFMVIDEAAKIPHADIWENQLSTRLLDRQGRSLHISSPMGVKGYFAALYRLGQNGSDKRIVSMRLPSWLNPYLKKEEILYEKSRLPDKVFRQEWGAELLADGGMVFSPQDLDQVFSLDSFEEPHPKGVYFGSLDLAMTQDWSVLIVAREPWPNQKRPRIVRVERFYKLPIEAQLSRVSAIQEAYNDCPLNVDESGLGKPIVEQMRNANMNIRGIITSAQGKTSKMDQVKNAASLIERHGILLPKRELIPVFYDEMSLYQWDRTVHGNLTASAPPGQHDDCVASFLLLCWWLRAAGTSGDGRSYRAGDRPKTEGPKRPAMKVEGLAKVEADDPDGGVWTSPRGRSARLWGNKLFGRGRVW